MLSWLHGLFAPTPRLPLASWTWRARWALHTAIQHAEERGAAKAGTDDLLYGLARTDEGVGRALLCDLGVRLDDLLPAGEALIATSEHPPDVPLGRWTDGVEAVFRAAQAEAARAGHCYLGTEHLVLGLLRAGSDAGRLLKERGASLQSARKAMVQMLDS
jgi:ATP-dependent Clp protease ATP-binding subunit ClpC